jgi:hypothetical protein
MDASSSPRTIQVKNSEANENQGDGRLHILASGAITLQNFMYIGSNERAATAAVLPS